ncbi:transmembrane protein 165 [Trichonephila clavata]|uniref:GDT1 family protein n=1 Tax=Trichonephila clavata TaxID=2740835 RepID=A0A8X6FS54_TRICU|nr:transmembrane protein 165 [Trichonephila clavata]
MNWTDSMVIYYFILKSVGGVKAELQHFEELLPTVKFLKEIESIHELEDSRRLRIVTMLRRNDFVRIFFLASSLSWRAAVLADDLTTYPNGLMSTETSLVVGGNGTLPSFVSGVLSAFTVTAVSEIGDKTFFIALVLALAHSPAVVYGGALSALALMTVLSASLGLVFSYLSALWVHYLSALLFLLFGLKMLREGYMMSSDAGKEEMEEVQKTVETKMGWKSDVELGGVKKASLRWVFMEAFTMTFLSEWGDRSQIATVILAAKHVRIAKIFGPYHPPSLFNRNLFKRGFKYFIHFIQNY